MSPPVRLSTAIMPLSAAPVILLAVIAQVTTPAALGAGGMLAGKPPNPMPGPWELASVLPLMETCDEPSTTQIPPPVNTLSQTSSPLDWAMTAQSSATPVAMVNAHFRMAICVPKVTCTTGKGACMDTFSESSETWLSDEIVKAGPVLVLAT